MIKETQTCQNNYVNTLRKQEQATREYNNKFGCQRKENNISYPEMLWGCS